MTKQMRVNGYLHGGDYNPEQWLDHPEILKKDIEYFKKAHINEATLGVFSWSMLEPREGEYHFEWLGEIIDNLYKEGISTILATPSGARPKWLANKYPEVLRVDENRQRNLFGGRHNHCYTSPVYREKVRAIDKKLAEAFGKHPGVILWHISNEFGGECHCPLCQKKFQEWLEKKYQTIENLNDRWCTTFWSHRYESFADVESPSARGEREMHALKLDWKRFVTDQTVDFMRAEAAAIREGGSKLPVTTNMMYDYSGLDYKKFRDVLDIASLDNYPFWHKKEEKLTAAESGLQYDLIRSIKKKPFLLMESCPTAVNWNRVCKLKKPGMLLAASLQAAAHGSDSVQYFQLRQSRGSFEKFHGAVIDHYGGEDTRVFQEVTEVGKALEQIGETAGSGFRSQAAVLYDRENDWALKDTTALKNEDMHYQDFVLKHYRALREKGLNVDILSMEHDLRDYRLLSVPMGYLFKEGYEEKLRKFAEDGGTLVLTYWTGLADETDRCFLGGTPFGLMEAAGLRSTETDALYDWEENYVFPEPENHLGLLRSYSCKNICDLVKVSDAEVLMRYGEDFYAGYPAVTCKAFGKGRVYYICADMEDAFYHDFYQAAAEEAGLKAPVEFVPDGVSVTLREGKEADYLFIQNFARVSQTVPFPGEYEMLYGSEGEVFKPLETKVLKRKR